MAKQFSGHRRTIARRGTEIFVVVENEIRWSDLCMLKDAWEETQREQKKGGRDANEREDTNEDFELVDQDIANVGYRVGCLYLQRSHSYVLMIDLGFKIFNQRTDPTAFNIS